jgi:hypothetical protein
MNGRQAEEHNVRIFMRHGPGIRVDYELYVVARDPANKRLLIGGLGGCGMGQAWFPETEEHAKYSGYDDAPYVNDDLQPLEGRALLNWNVRVENAMMQTRAAYLRGEISVEFSSD